jgi:hypothetical protein
MMVESQVVAAQEMSTTTNSGPSRDIGGIGINIQRL